MKIDTSCLRNAIDRYAQIIPELLRFEDSLKRESISDLINLYEQCFPLIEKAMWDDVEDFDEMLACYQSLYREQEALILRDGDDRHLFILSIPVADRPSHLETCLESIYQICEKFGYGGKKAGVYQRVKIVVAEDSREYVNIQRHIELVDHYRQKGLEVFHFGQDEQFSLLSSFSAEQQERLGNILTTLPKDKFYLKGQAANRNLSYLKCLQLTEDGDSTLYYMVDSDQSFCVNRKTANGEQIVYALNYFLIIDRIFRESDINMLTGKLVGDPPVSPSVMAGNFLDDLLLFFSSMAAREGAELCQFHDDEEAVPGDADYHDMSSLFGFENKAKRFPYRCSLSDEHDHAACLRNFCQRLNAFFSGEHLTRRTYYQYRKGPRETVPARTIYPGNYVVNREGLKYIIPFGNLRLRMSGPTAGRLIAAEIKDRFVSVNLPHMHRRTSPGGVKSDFRPGVELAENKGGKVIDLSDEFERQFFGDLMLFTAEALVKQVDVKQPFPEDAILALLQKCETKLLALYQQKHQSIRQKSKLLRARVFEDDHWWLRDESLKGPLKEVASFIDTLEHNFGETSRAWLQIQSSAHRERRKRQILEALVNYRSERDAWDELFL